MARVLVVSHTVAATTAFSGSRHEATCVHPTDLGDWLDRSEDVDLVVLDLAGTEQAAVVLETIRARLGPTPAVLLSDNEPNGRAAELRRLPDLHVLARPVDQGALVSTVEDVLDGATPRSRVDARPGPAIDWSPPAREATLLLFSSASIVPDLPARTAVHRAHLNGPVTARRAAVPAPASAPEAQALVAEAVTARALVAEPAIREPLVPEPLIPESLARELLETEPPIPEPLVLTPLRVAPVPPSEPVPPAAGHPADEASEQLPTAEPADEAPEPEPPAAEPADEAPEPEPPAAEPADEAPEPEPPAAEPDVEPAVSDPSDARSLVRLLTDRVGELDSVPGTAAYVTEYAVEQTRADAGVLMLPDSDRWRVSAGVELRKLEYRYELTEASWLIHVIVHGNRAALIADSDIARARLQGAPLGSWRNLIVVPIPAVDGLLLLARGDDPPFDEANLITLTGVAREAGPILASALEVRGLARALAPLRDEKDVP